MAPADGVDLAPGEVQGLRGMNADIGPGDLVYVKRWPCCGSLFGTFHAVDRVEAEHPLGGRCLDCGEYHEPQGLVAEFENGRAAPLTWLRKVPPLTDDEILDEVARLFVEAGV